MGVFLGRVGEAFFIDRGWLEKPETGKFNLKYSFQGSQAKNLESEP